MHPVPMEQAFDGVAKGRARLILALDLLEKHPDGSGDVEALRGIVGELAAMLGRWERERARWQPAGPATDTREWATLREHTRSPDPFYVGD